MMDVEIPQALIDAENPEAHTGMAAAEQAAAIAHTV